MESVAFIQWCLEHLNYYTVMLLMTLESTIFPIPSEIVVPPAAYHAAATGEMNLIVLILCATLGACLGASINYSVSLWIGKPIVYRFANSRVGHMLLLTQEKVQKAEGYFNRHGAVSTFIGRLLPVIRHLISIPAGLARMPYGKFITFTALGAGIWNICLASAGYFLESVYSEEQLVATITKYSHEFGYTLLALVTLVLAYMIWKGVKPAKAKSAPEEEEIE
ncbi:MAG: DedA family protein [Bacteroidaceae bacterium]|nr:DedA family protein [Bacteroidaceae bacterium]